MTHRFGLCLKLSFAIVAFIFSWTDSEAQTGNPAARMSDAEVAAVVVGKKIQWHRWATMEYRVDGVFVHRPTYWGNAKQGPYVIENGQVCTKWPDTLRECVTIIRDADGQIWMHGTSDGKRYRGATIN